MVQCRQCGGEVAEGSKFCTWCGGTVAAASATAAVAAPVAAAAPAPAFASSAVVSSAPPVQEGYVWGAQQNAAPNAYAQPACGQPAYGQTPYGQPTYGQPTFAPAAPASAATPGKIDGLGIAAIAFLFVSTLLNFVNALSAGMAGVGTFAVLMYIFMGLIAASLAMLLLKKLKSAEPISTGLKVAILILGSLVSGILLFVRK